MHKYRQAMVIPGRDVLTDTVEVDETFVAGQDWAIRTTITPS